MWAFAIAAVDIGGDSAFDDEAAKAAEEAAKASAQAKLAVLGLTPEEVATLTK